MTSKWISEIEDAYADGAYWEDILEYLLSIEKLLSRAALETDDEMLHDDIMKELKEDV